MSRERLLACTAILNVLSVQRIVAVLLKEIDDIARNGIREELASLDPLLRSVAVQDERDQYDHDG